VTAPVGLVAISKPEPDLIDRIAAALPEEVRAEYYRELLHCRALPENDEMLRLLRAMQFLVLLIEQAPSRVAEERERLDLVLASAIDNIGRMGAASESYHAALDRRLAELPASIAKGISPAAVAEKINENLQLEFMRYAIPQTAQALGAISEKMKKTCVEFSATSDDIGHAYRGAAEDARKAIASLQSEISVATENAKRFSGEIAARCSTAFRWASVLIAGGCLVLGLALGMMFERWLVTPGAPTAEAPATEIQTLPEAPATGNKPAVKQPANGSRTYSPHPAH